MTFTTNANIGLQSWSRVKGTYTGSYTGSYTYLFGHSLSALITPAPPLWLGTLSRLLAHVIAQFISPIPVAEVFTVFYHISITYLILMSPRVLFMRKSSSVDVRQYSFQHPMLNWQSSLRTRTNCACTLSAHLHPMRANQYFASSNP
ncbi:hypothetical protein P154DRAFT_224072 [Amniculicola lignicola CBS 123094]|uniref:Uncharacterized protein n=1 Tax=Amniculicola lignicola CBS 123094 TaxID=1392246 RepID=A0A6A5X292_9PLEO|nr:hypothetical protein P154DRAFT_224072 [Amniculicola lignicola CBS 123094]